MASSKYEVVSQTIDELLSPRQALFEVPRFQRSYSWGKDEVSQLLDDLYNDPSETELPYFLGSLVLARNNESNQTNSSLLVLDGQQRLTTISLLFAALISRLEEENHRDVREFNTMIFCPSKLGKKSGDQNFAYNAKMRLSSRHWFRTPKFA